MTIKHDETTTELPIDCLSITLPINIIEFCCSQHKKPESYILKLKKVCLVLPNMFQKVVFK